MATQRGIGPVPENLNNAELDQFLTQVRRVLIDAQSGRIASLLGGTTSTTIVVGGGGGGSGGGGTPYVPDLTPPPTPSGVVVTAGLDFVFIETDPPIFTQGNGYYRTLVYGATYSGTGPLPTFLDAVVVHEYVGQVGSFATPPGTQWHIWVKWITNDDVESTDPEGGANGHQVTTALIGNSNLGPLIIEAANLVSGAVTAAKFAAGIEPVSIVGTLPAALGYTGPKMVFLTTDGKLYRYVAGAWTTSVPTVDLTGQITSTQITDGAISTPKLAAGAVTASTIAANTITANEIAANAITASELAANSVVAGKIAAAAVSATEISAGAIQATHLAANSIAVGTAAIQNGAIVNAMLGNATITDAKIANVSATKLTAGTIAVGQYIQSSDFNSGVSGWRMGGNTAEIGSTYIRGQLTASQIDTRNLTIKDGAGAVIFGAGQNLDWNRISGTAKPVMYRIVATGLGAVGYPASPGVYDAETNSLFHSPGRSYNLLTITRSTGARTFQSFDVYGNGEVGGTATTLAAALNALTSAQAFWLFSYDEPANLRTTGGLPAAIYRNGGTPGKFESPLFITRGAYVLGGYGGCGQGNALFEGYAGVLPYGTDGPDDAWIDTTFSLVNGNVVVGGGGMAGFKLDASNVSTYIASAAIGDAQIGTLNASKIIAGSITTDKIQVGAVSAAGANNSSTSYGVISNVSAVSRTNDNVVSLTTTGAPVTAQGFVDVYITISGAAAASVALARVTWASMRRDTFDVDYAYLIGQSPGPAYIPLGVPVSGRTGSIRIPFLGREVLAAGTHNWGWRIDLQFLDVNGAAINTNCELVISSKFVVQENKV